MMALDSGITWQIAGSDRVVTSVSVVVSGSAAVSNRAVYQAAHSLVF
jgi:hypothetical protein